MVMMRPLDEANNKGFDEALGWSLNNGNDEVNMMRLR